MFACDIVTERGEGRETDRDRERDRGEGERERIGRKRLGEGAGERKL